MRCSIIKSLISPYLDNELGQADKVLFELHINGCLECRKELDSAQALHKLFEQAKKQSAPYGFRTRVMAHTALGRKKDIRIPLFAGFAEALIVLAMVVLGIFSGSMLVNGFIPQKEAFAASLSLDVFAPAPPGTIGSAYLAMTEAGHEK